MGGFSRDDVPVAMQEEIGESRITEAGDMTIAFERWSTDLDAAPLFKGLPDDMCQCPHWGYLFSGRIRIRTKDGEEIVEAGQAYHLAPGHIPEVLEECELVEFSPTGEYQKTMAQIEKNMEAMQSAQS